MTVKSEAVTAGEKELRRDWPNVEGLILGTTKQEGTSGVLEPEEDAVPIDQRWGTL